MVGSRNVEKSNVCMVVPSF